MLRIYAIMAATVLVAAVGGVWLSTLYLRPDSQFAECGGSQVAGGASQIGGPFELVNAAGDTVTDTDVITEPSLIYFGYTYCPDVCPLDMSRNADAVDLLEARGKQVTPVFITVDPARDTPEVVGDFATSLHERGVGLTGSPEQIRGAAQAYKAFYKVHPTEDDFYPVDHTTLSYLVLPEHGFVQVFRRDEQADALADKVACYIDHA